MHFPLPLSPVTIIELPPRWALPLIFAIGLLGVLTIMLQPLRLFMKRKNFAGLGNKAFASLFFCIAGVVAAGMRDFINWQAAIMLLSFCLAAIGDVLLAMGPVLKEPRKDQPFIFAVGGASFAAAHILTFVALLSFVPFDDFDWRTFGIALFLPLIYIAFWIRGKLKLGRNGGPIVFYALILSALLWAAIHTLAVDQTLGLFTIAVAVLYIISDTALFFSNFGSDKAKKKLRSGKSFLFLVMLPYYLAQALLACALLVI